jgi:hypothetical protein
MSSKIYVSFAWNDVDADKLARDWAQDASGTHREFGNKASAIATLAAAFNHLAARQAPVLFDRIAPRTACDTTGADPLYQWRGPRRNDNGRTYSVRITTPPRVLDSNNESYALRWNTAAGEITVPSNIPGSAVNAYYDCHAEEFESAERGSPSDLATDGLSTNAGYTVYDVVVQEPGLSSLTTGTHLYVDPVAAKPEGEVLVSHLPQVAHAFHRLRETQLPRALSWAAVTMSDAAAIAVTNVGKVNLFDVNVTSRNENTPGAMFYCYRAGVGREDQAPGKRVPISCRVLANAVVATNVSFQGPDHVTGNSINIQIAGNAAPTWYEAAGQIWGNPAAHENTVDVNRNKIDVFSEGVAAGTLKVWGIQCEMNTPMPFSA